LGTKGTVSCLPVSNREPCAVCENDLCVLAVKMQSDSEVNLTAWAAGGIPKAWTTPTARKWTSAQRIS